MCWKLEDRINATNSNFLFLPNNEAMTKIIKRYKMYKMLKYAFNKLDWVSKGFCIDDQMFSHLRFANDIIITDNFGAIRTMLTELIAKKIGHKISQIFYNSSGIYFQQVELGYQMNLYRR